MIKVGQRLIRYADRWNDQLSAKVLEVDVFNKVRINKFLSKIQKGIIRERWNGNYDTTPIQERIFTSYKEIKEKGYGISGELGKPRVISKSKMSEIKINKDEMTHIGTFYGKKLYLETANEDVVKKAKDFLKELLEECGYEDYEK